jgi:RNA polymerase-associated protein
MTLIDACLAPIMWRLNLLGIVLDDKAKPISAYANTLFSQVGFQESLTFCEKDFSQ